jgi:hypothetical protein
MYTGYVTCQNGTSSEEYLKREIRRIHISPGCSLDLKNHTLTSEFSLYLDSSIKYVSWEKEDLSLFGIGDEDISETFSQAVRLERGVMLTDVIETSKARRNSLWTRFLYLLIGLFAPLGLIVLIVTLFGTQRFVRIKSKLKNLKVSLAALVPVLASQMNRILSHLNLPQLPLQRFNIYPDLPLEANPHNVPPPPFAPEPPGY